MYIKDNYEDTKAVYFSVTVMLHSFLPYRYGILLAHLYSEWFECILQLLHHLSKLSLLE